MSALSGRRTSAAVAMRAACSAGRSSFGDPFGNHFRFQVVTRTLLACAGMAEASVRNATQIAAEYRRRFGRGANGTRGVKDDACDSGQAAPISEALAIKTHDLLLPEDGSGSERNEGCGQSCDEIASRRCRCTKESAEFFVVSYDSLIQSYERCRVSPVARGESGVTFPVSSARSAIFLIRGA